MFISEDWRSPFIKYLTEGILPQSHSKRYKFKRLVTRYFLHNTVLFKKGYDGDPLRCLGPEEVREMIREVQLGECGEHQGKKKLYRYLLQIGYYWPTMKRDAAEFVKKCHSCQIQANLIHTHPQNLLGMVTPWPFHTWGLDLVGPVNPPSRGYIWILVATEYFTKWAEAIPLRKGQLVLKVADYVRRGMVGPFKFAPKWGGPFVIREAYQSVAP